MSTNPNPIYPSALRTIAGTVVNSNGTGIVAVYTAGTNGTRIDCLNITSTDTSNHDISIYVTKSGGSAQLIGTVQVAASAGTTSSNPAKNVLTDANLAGVVTDAYGNKVLYLEGSAVLSVAAAVAVTSAKTVYVNGMGGEY